MAQALMLVVMLVLTLVLTVSVHNVAFASPMQGFGPCTFGVSRDSHSLGQYEGLVNGGEVTTPRGLDLACFQMGIQSGRQIRAQELFGAALSRVCLTDIVLGEVNGSELTSELGSACFEVGYERGVALWNLAVRSGDLARVGSQCLSLYRQGQRDSQSHRTINWNFENERQRHCYFLGYY